MIVFVCDVLSPIGGERYGKDLNDIRMRGSLKSISRTPSDARKKNANNSIH